jgi:hypothetical protein
MLDTFQRQLTEAERRSLTRTLESGGTIPSMSVIFFSLGFLGVAALSFIGLIAMGPRKASGHAESGLGNARLWVASIVLLLGLSAAANLIGGLSRRRKSARRFETETATRIRAALADGRATVRHVTSDRVVVVEEFEDEGSAYIFDLGDDTSLYLRGGQYFPEDEGAPWPARSFEMVSSTLNHYWVGIFAAEGTPAQIRTVQMEEMPETFVWSDEPRTESILPGTPDDIVSELGV